MRIIILLVLTTYSLNIFSQGSGNALDFQGSNQYVAVPTITGTFNTIEFWINKDQAFDGSSANAGNLFSFSNTSNAQWIWSNNCCGAISNEKFSMNNSGVSYYDGTISNGWHHIAVVSNGSIYNTIYIDGIASPLKLFNNIGTTTFNNSVVNIGARVVSPGYYNGKYDELRIWSTQRTQTEIRDFMCEKLTGTEAGLLAYYNFDEGTGTVLTDLVSGNNGTLINAPNWLLSEAPIGDESSHNYPASANWTGETVNLTSPNRGDFEVNNVTGTPSGIHVYRVDAVPNSVIGISPSLGSNNTYYGTFVANGTTPTYNVEYDYSNYADAIADEPNLLLYSRDNNAVSSWTDLGATVNAGSNTLTESNLPARAEFIIAGSAVPLPIQLVSFSAQVIENSNIEVSWKTATEINNDYFTIQRSINGVKWETVKTIKGAGNSSNSRNYSIIDDKPYNELTYYRLKQTDFDGQFEYFNTVSVNFDNVFNSPVLMFPNPTIDKLTIQFFSDETQKINIYDALGRDVTVNTFSTKSSKQKMVIDLSELNSGLYYIKTSSSLNKIYKK